MEKEKTERHRVEDLAEDLGIDELDEVAKELALLKKLGGRGSLSDFIAFYMFMKYIEEKKDREWRSIVEEIREKERERILETKKSIDRILQKYEEMIDSFKSILSLPLTSQRRIPSYEVEA